MVAPGPPLSLREAVTRADTQPGPDFIQLDPGATYTLELCGGGTPDDTNAAGDLDITAADDLFIDGLGATILQTCGERVLHASSSAAVVTVDGTTITGGDLTGRSGVEGLGGGIRTSGRLVVHNSSIVAAKPARSRSWWPPTAW